ncbi:helix-turn-helix transcriptional regulator [Kribbella sp. CA-293567]|uniref:helix-turn-helix transcriptional regulator n=1 Tax=Kribbella sp. CA-293567 TaxID=3002436 RepID=UPI0022DE821F|nr:WYL domain-containing protein [Kribbella sp. CA-293567]WBQ02642.1 WYL domain-containing protein [Kribbella sp. CA-293567]
MDELSPTAKALLALELIQECPGISGERLGLRLGVTDRAARRYVGILREAGIPIESSPGRYGGYRVGRGFRLPPLMFSTAEALGLMMAALEGHHQASDPEDPAGSALSKIIRVLPKPVAEPAESMRRLITPRQAADGTYPDPETTAALVQACAAGRRLRIGYRRGDRDPVTMDVDPWAVSVRQGLWYLLCWSHTKDAQRVLRVDRVTTTETLPETFTPIDGLDPVTAIEDHFAQGWRYAIEVIIDAPLADIVLARKLGRLEPIDETHTRLIGSTDEPDWYAYRLAALEHTFSVVEPPELREALQVLGQRILKAAEL